MGQLNELTINKNVMYCNKQIKNHPETTKDVISWLNNNVIKHMHDSEYIDDINKLILNLDDEKFKDEFIKNIKETNLYIECPAFAEINMKKIINDGINPQENILIKKELIEFMEDSLKVNLEFEKKDTIVPNIFCGPMYMQKLYKIASKIITARDLGNLKSISKQPLRGKAQSGGSKLGQMEIESILSGGAEKALRELLTVKSDWNQGKKQLVREMIKNGKYNFPKDVEISSRSKNVVSSIIKFLKD